VAGGALRGQLTPSFKFWAVGKLSENVLYVGKFLSTNAKYGAKNLHSGKI